MSESLEFSTSENVGDHIIRGCKFLKDEGVRAMGIWHRGGAGAWDDQVSLVHLTPKDETMFQAASALVHIKSLIIAVPYCL